jgi:hypothetical protein
MKKIAIGLAFAVLLSPAGTVVPASAADCSNRLHRSGASCNVREFAAQTKRPRVTIYRRSVYPRPNAVRQCYSWLATEYRVSGTVIVPQMRCWWE